MEIVRKSATVTAPTDDEFPGTFEVILSNAQEDRDGETLTQDTWKSLPAHIPFDIDHEMSVRGTVGSGAPSFDTDGNLVVKGTFSSLPQAQEVRTLIKEGHITKTSVAFSRDRSGVKDGKPETRELLNGAFVAIPSNRSADILIAKGFAADGIKLGARNNTTDAKHIQAIHDHAAALGAKHGNETDDSEGADPADADASDDDNKTFLAAFKAASDDIRAQVKSLLTVDDNSTDPAAADIKSAAAEPSADDIALKARALAWGLTY